METPDQATPESTQTDPSTSYLEQLVGEGKKYSNPEELAKAYFNADGFINHLKNETGSLREELEKRMTLEELLAEKQQEQQISTEPKAVEQPQETPVIEPSSDRGGSWMSIVVTLKRSPAPSQAGRPSPKTSMIMACLRISPTAPRVRPCSRSARRPSP